MRNWSEYNQALVNRGSLSLWVDDEVIEQWYEAEHSGKQGAPRTYSDLAIQCALTLRVLFKLPLRATEGLMQSILRLLDTDLKCPCYTQFSRRQKDLDIAIKPHHPNSDPMQLVIDATGLKVFGEGEWKVRQHGVSKRRTWRKVHLAINPRTHDIEASLMTTSNTGDNEVIDDLLDQVSGSIDSVAADGAYDTFDCYASLKTKGAKALIPPRRGARIIQHGNCHCNPHPRDTNIRMIRKLGRKRWKKLAGYHQRSLAETGMYRFKQLFGATLMSRKFNQQNTEVHLRCRVINKMNKLGMPKH